MALVKFSYVESPEFVEGQHGGMLVNMAGFQLIILSEEEIKKLTEADSLQIEIGSIDEEDLHARVRFKILSREEKELKAFKTLSKLANLESEDIYKNLIILEKPKKKYKSKHLPQEELLFAGKPHKAPEEIKKSIREEAEGDTEQAIQIWERNVGTTEHYLDPYLRDLEKEYTDESGVIYSLESRVFGKVEFGLSNPYIKWLDYPVYNVVDFESSNHELSGYVYLKDLPQFLKILSESKNLADFKTRITSIRHQLL